MNKSFKKIWNIITSVLVILVILLALLLVGVRIIGLRPLTVLSGSMEPEYHVGSLIYVKSVDKDTLATNGQIAVGDDITYTVAEDTVVTHRVIEILHSEEDYNNVYFRTQGIANDAPDGEPVWYMNVVGKPVFTIPYLGYVANYIQSPPGLYVAIAGAAVLLILVFLPDLLSEDDKKKSKKDTEKVPAEAPADQPED